MGIQGTRVHIHLHNISVYLVLLAEKLFYIICRISFIIPYGSNRAVNPSCDGWPYWYPIACINVRFIVLLTGAEMWSGVRRRSVIMSRRCLISRQSGCTDVTALIDANGTPPKKLLLSYSSIFTVASNSKSADRHFRPLSPLYDMPPEAMQLPVRCSKGKSY